MMTKLNRREIMTMTMRGIDVSYANGPIDWGKVKNSGLVDFAIIRSTFGSDLPSQIDNYYFQNADGCVKNKIPFGTYHFAYFINRDKAIEEAQFAIRKANEYKNYVKFIALDIEEDSERYATRMGVKPNWTECAIAFCETVKAAGYIPIIYTNQSWILNKFDWSQLSKYQLWYAAPYASSPVYKCSIWQDAWNRYIPGIIGNVDTDVCYDDTLFEIKKPTKTKTVDEIAKEVIAGKWGVDEERKKKLTAAGYDYNTIQKRVNQLIKPVKEAPKKKTVDELAKEVIEGKWGVDYDRKKKLTEAGYDYTAVQKRVNDLMLQSQKTIAELAKEVIDGKWGNGRDRYNKLTAAGYDYNAVQKRVNDILKGR